MGTVTDLKVITIFLLHFVLLLGTGLALPGFLADLPAHSSSFEAATRCAEYHLSMLCGYFCEVFNLMLAWRTYKILVYSAMFGSLVPGACLAEPLPHLLSRIDPSTGRSSSTALAVRFVVGLLLWIGILAGAVNTTRAAFGG